MELEKILSVHEMLDFLWGLTENKRLHILTFWWLWWSNRNKLREGELPVATEEIARRARCCVLEYQQIFGLPLARKNTDKWCPPCDDMIKINMDGSFLPGETHAGWGVVARTAEGDIICAQAGRQENVQDAFAAEVHAMAHAVSLAAEMGMIRVVFETDSQLLSEALDLWRVDSSAYSAVIEDIKLQLKLWFSKHVISFCRRSANNVAHELANMGCACEPNHSVLWESDVPANVAACAMGDLSK
uniref:RNase H type-1 domain-containing protein n=1 Tax=Aegilops tauschii subsp. strangulata TaxID=200361 RepID=A0A453Q0S8_AEGTS